jgi:hypothetical protein
LLEIFEPLDLEEIDLVEGLDEGLVTEEFITPGVGGIKSACV